MQTTTKTKYPVITAASHFVVYRGSVDNFFLDAQRNCILRSAEGKSESGLTAS